MDTIRSELSFRIRELQKFVQILDSIKNPRGLDTPKRTLKGLFFVHAYAIIEYVVYVRIPEQSYHPFRFIVTTDSAAL